MEEILPGIHHWTALHPKIGIEVSSYCLLDERVLIDPLLPAEGLDWFREHGAPREIYLTNRHHYRHSGEIAAAFGATVRCHRAGLHEFTHGEAVTPFDFGDELPGGIVAREVGAICPEETGLHIVAARAIALADAIVRFAPGPLGFVPDEYLGEDPDGVKRDIRASVARLLDLDFDHLLLAHGGPVLGDGKAQLRALAGAGG